MKKCCHDLNCKDSTVIVSKKRKMVYPNRLDGCCKICKKILNFVKDEDGNFILVSKKASEINAEEK